jgi:hypothetical protein
MEVIARRSNMDALRRKIDGRQHAASQAAWQELRAEPIGFTAV